MSYFFLAADSRHWYRIATMDFANALTDWMTKDAMSDKALGERLSPPVSYSAVRRWRMGEAEPRRIHRRQLIHMSKGIINHKHFT